MPRKKAVAKARPSKKVPVKNDIGSVEEETIKRVDRTLTTIETFLAKWDHSRIKPDDMLPQIVKIRQFHDALARWQTDAVKGKEKNSEDMKVKRLRDFVLICRTYS